LLVCLSLILLNQRITFFPNYQLHFKIGTVDNVLEALLAFLEEKVEVLSEEKIQCRNTDVALERAKDNLRFNCEDLKFYKLERVELNNRLKARGLSEESRNE
jgi:VIT1/CCC1 family predicted Fe2+/Mn2+ transporter